MEYNIDVSVPAHNHYLSKHKEAMEIVLKELKEKNNGYIDEK